MNNRRRNNFHDVFNGVVIVIAMASMASVVAVASTNDNHILVPSMVSAVAMVMAEAAANVDHVLVPISIHFSSLDHKSQASSDKSCSDHFFNTVGRLVAFKCIYPNGSTLISKI